MTVITISRELGSEGDKIAEMLCERLGFCRLDRAMVMQIADEAGIDVEAIEELERNVTRRARLVSDEMTSLYRKQSSAFEKPGAIDDRTYKQVVRETFEEYARAGEALIVGRGGQMVLRDWPDALHVRVFAPEDVRVGRIMEREKVPPKQAGALVKRSDERKRQYIRRMYDNANWQSLKYYHLAIDTSKIPPETAAEMIVLAAKAITPGDKQGEP
jgi:cytidylate kinase